MNNFRVTINGTHYTNAVFPFKYGEFLDEQLDYATLTLSRVSTEIFAPLTPVTVEIISRGTNGTQTKTKNYIIANDDGRETPNGSGFYRHELTLVEETKYLEGFMVESLCVTNAGGRDYKTIKPFVEEFENNYLVVTVPDYFYTPVPVGTIFKIPNVDEITNIKDTTYPIYGFGTNPYYVTVTYSSGEQEKFEISTRTGDVNGNVNVTSGVQTVNYRFQLDANGGAPWIDFSFSLRYVNKYAKHDRFVSHGKSFYNGKSKRLSYRESKRLFNYCRRGKRNAV